MKYLHVFNPVAGCSSYTDVPLELKHLLSICEGTLLTSNAGDLEIVKPLADEPPHLEFWYVTVPHHFGCSLSACSEVLPTQ